MRDAAQELLGPRVQGADVLFLGRAADFNTVFRWLSQFTQRIFQDMSILSRRNRQHVADLRLLFGDAYILSPAAKHSFTTKILAQMRQKPMYLSNGDAKALGKALQNHAELANLELARAALLPIRRVPKMFAKMLAEQIDKKHAEQHLEHYDLHQWGVNARDTDIIREVIRTEDRFTRC